MKALLVLLVIGFNFASAQRIATNEKPTADHVVLVGYCIVVKANGLGEKQYTPCYIYLCKDWIGTHEERITMCGPFTSHSEARKWLDEVIEDEKHTEFHTIAIEEK